MRALSWIVALFAWVVGVSTTYADPIERIRPQKLQAVHETIKALKSQRRKVSLTSGYDDVRSLLHVHSAFSHDSRGTIEEVVAAAKEAGGRVIMFSEHPSSKYNFFLDGHRDFKEGVLLIPGAETGGFLAYPRQSIQDQTTDTPQAFADLVRSTGGLIFLCHLEERMDWEIANITGTEIYNTHADFKEETHFLAALRSPLMMFSLVEAVKQYPQEVFGALLDYPADYLKRFDQLCQKARHTGIAGNDSHHNQAYRAKVLDNGQVLVEDALGTKIAKLDPEKLAPIKLLTAGKKSGDLILDLDLDPYARSFRHVSTHLLLTEVNDAQVWQALSNGRAYVAFDWIADPTGFVFRAERGADNWPIGSEVCFSENLHLRAEAPLDGRFKLVREGEVVLDQSGPALDFPVDKPGCLPRRGLAEPGRRTSPLDPHEPDLRAWEVTVAVLAQEPPPSRPILTPAPLTSTGRVHVD